MNKKIFIFFIIGFSFISPSMVLCEEALNKQPDLNSFLGLPSPPPPWVPYIGFLIAALALIWKIIDTFYQKWQKTVERRRHYLVSLWGDQTLVPIFLKPLREFSVNFSENISTDLIPNENLQDMTEKKAHFDAFKVEFRNQKRNLVNRALVLKAVFGKAYIKISERLDLLEDDIIQYLAQQSGFELNENRIKIKNGSEAQKELYEAHGDILNALLEEELYK